MLKLKNRQTSRKAATQSYRACNMAASCPFQTIPHMGITSRAVGFQSTKRRALYQPFGWCGALLFWPDA